MERYFLEFETSPTPSEEAREGRDLMQRIAASLERSGHGLLEGVAPWQEYGWSLVIDAGGQPLWCLLQRSDSWLMISWVQIGLIDRLRGKSQPSEVCAARAAILDAITSVASTGPGRWMSEQEFHSDASSK